MIRILALFCCLVVAPVARAHPHVFVDVGLSFESDGAGQISGVEVTWRYDALFSLLVLSDRGLDPDGDMVLTEAERAELMGFDLTDWPEGFDGALFLTSGGARVALGAPEAISITMEEGQIVTRHRRPLQASVAPADLIVRPFDPSYYAALSLTGALTLPEGCTGAIEGPDTERADAKVAALGGFGDEGAFEEVEVGEYYADTLFVTCAQS